MNTMLGYIYYTKFRRYRLWFFLGGLVPIFAAGVSKPPRVTIVIVIDSCAKSLLNRTAPFLTDGLKTIFEKGLSYEEAYHPHGIPETAPGHATLATGTSPINHGWIRNEWYEAGILVKPDQDDRPESRTINPLDGSVYDYGSSAHRLMVDSLGDQCAVAEVGHKIAVYALSAKARSAIPCAGHAGKAFWFDGKTGCFTSSRAYFKELPSWLVQFNKVDNKDKDRTQFVWTLAHTIDDPAYAFWGVQQQDYTDQKSYLGSQMIDRSKKDPFEIFEKTPLADRLLAHCAQACFEDWIKDAPENAQLVLFISFSALDKINHLFGPWSREDLDILYHLDATIGDFMRAIESRIPKDQVLYAFSADHGNMPIISHIKERGIDFAQKINEKELAASLNAVIEKELGYKDMVVEALMPFVYCNHETFSTLPSKEQRKITKRICKYLKKQSYCLDAWPSKKLLYLPTDEKDMRWRLKKHLYPGRCGEVVFLFRPYTILSHHAGGTTHITPYDYDLHVPMILYRKGLYDGGERVTKPVDTTQLAPTLAALIGVPRPSASFARLLPGAVRF